MKKLYILAASALMLALVLSFSSCSCSTDVEPGSISSSNQTQQNGDKSDSISVDGRFIFTLSADKSYYTVAGLKDVSTVLTIPSEYEGKPVRAIADRAFEKYTKLEKVTIPNSITSIGDFAFSGCSSVRDFNIPKSVTEIGEGAFSSCDKLEYIDVDSGNTAYKSEKGSLCTRDGKVFLQYSIGRPNSETVLIPSTVRSIASYAFEGCQQIKEINIPLGVTAIGTNAFYNCDKLERVTISKSVSGIGQRSFANCNSLVEITVEDGNNIYKSIDGNLYAASREVLVQYAIGKTDKIFSVPASVTDIHSYAFAGSKNLQFVQITKRVTSVGDSAFAECENLVIRCATATQPDSWDENWNPNNLPVEWKSNN